MTSRDHLDMALKAVEAFRENGTLDASELREIVRIAERDGVIDNDEIRVLRSIISRVDPSEVDDELASVMRSLSRKITKA